MTKQIDKYGLADWMNRVYDRLWNTDFFKMREAEQSTAWEDKETRNRALQSVATQARDDILKFRTELEEFSVPSELESAVTKCNAYLDNLGNYFYSIASQDFGAAKRYLEAAETGFSPIFYEVLGLEGGKKAESEGLPPPPSAAPTVKEIIREKEVIIKVRCSYCSSLYDETLDACPNCGAKR